MTDQIDKLIAGHGLLTLALTFALTHFGPKIWAWISTTGTDEAVNKGVAFLEKALKAHGATDDEVFKVKAGIVQILNRIATDVQK